MGRLSALSRRAFVGLTLLWAASACEQGPTKQVMVTRERSQVVLGNPATAPEPSPSTPSQPPPVANAPRRLCGGALRSSGPTASREPVSRRAAGGESRLAEVVQLSQGHWTWVNFWAAWCVPCKEEIPRLRAWEDRLRATGHPFRVAFISLDDDERQLQAFLTGQPVSGLRDTYWLREGSERSDWLAKVGIDSGTELPVHVLVDPSGRVRCRVDGAVEDSDFSQLQALLNGAR